MYQVRISHVKKTYLLSQFEAHTVLLQAFFVLWNIFISFPSWLCYISFQNSLHNNLFKWLCLSWHIMGPDRHYCLKKYQYLLPLVCLNWNHLTKRFKFKSIIIYLTAITMSIEMLIIVIECLSNICKTTNLVFLPGNTILLINYVLFLCETNNAPCVNFTVNN